MSEVSTRIDEEHFRYIAERTQPEDQFLADLKTAARAADIPPIWIAPEQASLMQILLRTAKAKDVVEIGTLAGYSAIAMARALPRGGRVRTIELDPKRVKFAREWAAKSDAADRVEVLEGAGADVLKTFAADSADAAFLDADKGNYPVYLRECIRIVKKGGLIMVDNAFAFGQLFDDKPTDKEVGAVRAFNDLMAKTPEVQSVIVPIGDGLWVGVRK